MILEEIKSLFNQLGYVYRDKVNNKTSITDREADKVTKKYKEFTMEPEEEKWIQKNLGNTIKQPYRIKIPGKAIIDIFFSKDTNTIMDKNLYLNHYAEDLENRSIIIFPDDIFTMNIEKSRVDEVVHDYILLFRWIINVCSTKENVALQNLLGSYFVYCILSEDVLKESLNRDYLYAFKSLSEDLQYTSPYINEETLIQLITKFEYKQRFDHSFDYIRE